MSSIDTSMPFNFNSLLRPQIVNKFVLGLKIVLTAGTVAFTAVSFLRLSRGLAVPDLKFNDIASDIPAPKQSVNRKKNYQSIVRRNIFGTVGKPKTTSVKRTNEPPVTPLALDLIGTFISGDSPPYAIIEDKKQKLQDVFNLNDDIFGQAKLIRIYPTKVELSRNNRTEVLNLADEETIPEVIEGGVAAISEDRYIIDEHELDKALANLPLLLSQARSVPYFKDGRSIGLRMFAIKPNSMFQKIGLKNGDILKTINGRSLADPSQALKLFEELKDQRSLKVELERNRETREFQYDIR